MDEIPSSRSSLGDGGIVAKDDRDESRREAAPDVSHASTGTVRSERSALDYRNTTKMIS